MVGGSFYAPRPSPGLRGVLRVANQRRPAFLQEQNGLTFDLSKVDD